MGSISPIECDVVWEFDFIDLPEPIQNYIKARAATIVSGRIVGDDDQYTRLQQQEIQQRAMAMEYETTTRTVHYVWTSTRFTKLLPKLSTISRFTTIMPAVTQRVDDYLGGVSRQSDDKKLPGQVEECINGYPDPTFGLTKRPGFQCT